MFFNTYKDYVTDNGKTSLSPLMSLLGGMAAGCFSTLGNNPFDVVKTRMQGKLTRSLLSSAKQKHQSFGL
jgi:solute carrier family 25 (mitochondrial citrate transporter), member 1